MARYDAERVRRCLVDDSLCSVASEWERSEWIVPLGAEYDAAARWYERRCDDVDEDCVVVGEAKGSKRQREAAECNAALTPETMEFYDEVGWRFFKKTPAIRRSSRCRTQRIDVVEGDSPLQDTGTEVKSMAINCQNEKTKKR